MKSFGVLTAFIRERATRSLPIVFSFVILAGCGNKHEPGSQTGVSAERAPAEQSAPAPADSPSRYMAYEHAIKLEVAEERVAEVHQQAAAACLAAAAEQCVILESRIGTGRGSYAQITLRAKAAGIRQLMSALSAQGWIASQSTTAEDLAGPLKDSAKKLAMLNDYRSKLEVLRNKASGDIDAMITVNRELAQTQAEIEEISGARAHDLQRVNTEVLRLSISATGVTSSWRPVRDALDEFVDNLARGLSGAITAIAYLIPWSIAFLLLGGLARLLWRRIRKPAPKAAA